MGRFQHSEYDPCDALNADGSCSVCSVCSPSYFNVAFREAADEDEKEMLAALRAEIEAYQRDIERLDETIRAMTNEHEERVRIAYSTGWANGFDEGLDTGEAIGYGRGWTDATEGAN